MIILRILTSLILIAGGVAVVRYARNITAFLGPIDSIERLLGAGSTATFWRLVGLLIIIVSFLYMVGRLGGIFGSIGTSVGGFLPR